MFSFSTPPNVAPFQKEFKQQFDSLLERHKTTYPEDVIPKECSEESVEKFAEFCSDYRYAVESFIRLSDALGHEVQKMIDQNCAPAYADGCFDALKKKQHDAKHMCSLNRQNIMSLPKKTLEESLEMNKLLVKQWEILHNTMSQIFDEIEDLYKKCLEYEMVMEIQLTNTFHDAGLVRKIMDDLAKIW